MTVLRNDDIHFSRFLTFLFVSFYFSLRIVFSGSHLNWNAHHFVSWNPGQSGTNKPGCCLEQIQKRTSKFSVVMHWLIALRALIISSPFSFPNSWQSQDSAALVLRWSQIPLSCKQTVHNQHIRSQWNNFSELRPFSRCPHACQRSCMIQLWVMMVPVRIQNDFILFSFWKRCLILSTCK